MTKNLSSEITHLVALDDEDRRFAGGPIGAAARSLQLAGHRRWGGPWRAVTRRPDQLVAMALDCDPAVIDTLNHGDKLALLAVGLTRMLLDASYVRGGGHVLDGRVLLLRWEDLTAEARALFPPCTDQAIRRLASIATKDAAIGVRRPADTAKSLLTDGKLARALGNGAFND